ncbi:hypothetical protein PVW47_08070 [Marinovum sp. SP66]|uniref:hypothetical protein n=1 Tax=Marinovum TaxID=367771 RepID=UPI00237A9915|nr:hypothetical protein [Marinovum sp. SP66]MDD9739730.1 hypothetical protein [Marinovum sp. SP66]
MSSLLRIALPLTLWLASFSAIYGLHGLLCSSRWALAGVDLPGRGLLIAAAALAILLQVALILALRASVWPESNAVIRHISLGLGVVALVSTLWTLIPVVAVSHCL